MPLTEPVRRNIIIWYCLMCLGFFVYRYVNNGLLCQLVPAFFYNKMDFTYWLVQLTGLHKILLNNFSLCLVADLLFYGFPFLYLFLCLKRRTLIPAAGMIMVFINLVYWIIYCGFPTNSIEANVAFIIFPLMFIPLSLKGFWFMLNGIRYYFLFFFASSGLWKIAEGGLFNLQEMSGILLFQHKELLISDKSSVLLNLYKWLIEHPSISYWLYFTAALMELSFIVGFFTKKFDRLLIVFYLTFLVMDSVIMRIDYWETLPFLLCLVFSNYILEPAKYSQNIGAKALLQNL